MTMYCIKIEDVPRGSMMFRYRECKGIAELSNCLNELILDNPTCEVRSVEITDNYISTGEYVQFFDFEFRSQFFLTDYKSRLLAKHYEEQGKLA